MKDTNKVNEGEIRDLETLLKDSERIRGQSDALLERLKMLVGKLREWLGAEPDAD